MRIHTSDQKTASRYVDILCGAFLVRRLPPWFENTGKRLVKAPKVYIRDSGVLHTLLGLERLEQLESHPKLGASWEGFALEQLLSWHGAEPACFWATHGGAELDLCWAEGTRRIGVECKYTSAPVLTRSMRIALEDLQLSHLYVVHPGQGRFPLADRISAIGLEDAQNL